MADMTQSSAPTDPSDTDDTSPDMSGGYVIEIRVSADNKISVGVEPLAEESQEESGEGSDDYQPVASVGEACKLIREIVAHAGQMADSGADADAMSAGYGANS
jgi:hypothetical protein